MLRSHTAGLNKRPHLCRWRWRKPAFGTAYRQVQADAPRWRSLRFALTETLRDRHRNRSS